MSSIPVCCVCLTQQDISLGSTESLFPCLHLRHSCGCVCVGVCALCIFLRTVINHSSYVYINVLESISTLTRQTHAHVYTHTLSTHTYTHAHTHTCIHAYIFTTHPNTFIQDGAGAREGQFIVQWFQGWSINALVTCLASSTTTYNRISLRYLPGVL